MTKQGAAKAKATARKARDVAPEELLPPDLRDAGWRLLEHQGEDEREYACVNEAAGKETRLSGDPQQVIAAAYQIQKQLGASGEALPERPKVAGARFTHTLKRPLTADEINAKLDELKDMNARIAKLERERDETVKFYKEKIGGEEAERRELLDLLVARAVEDDVECYERWDEPAGVALILRADTDEEVDRRPLTPQEIHRPLPLA